jgi:hypothetical protein
MSFLPALTRTRTALRKTQVRGTDLGQIAGEAQLVQP